MDETVELIRALATGDQNASASKLTDKVIAVVTDNPILYDESHLSTDSKQCSSSLTPLHAAAIMNNVRFLDKLLSFAGETDCNGATSLMYACTCNSLEFVFRLSQTAEYDRELKQVDEEGRPALYYAIKADNFVLEKHLCEQLPMLKEMQIFMECCVFSVMQFIGEIDRPALMRCACDCLTLNSDTLLYMLTHPRASYDEEVALFQREATSVQWKRYLIQRPELGGLREVKKVKDVLSWQHSLIYNIVHSFKNGCCLTKLGQYGSDGRTALFHLLEMRLPTCTGKCPNPNPIVVVEYIDLQRHSIANVNLEGASYKPTAAKNRPLCHICHNNAFIECFTRYFSVLAIEYALMDEQRRTTPLHVFLRNPALINVLGPATSQMVIEALRPNSQISDWQSNYPLLVLAKNLPDYAVSFDSKFLEEMVQNCEIDQRFVAAVADLKSHISVLLPALLSSSRYLIPYVTSNLKLYEQAFTEFKAEQLQVEQFVPLLRFYVDNNATFFEAEISPLYALEFDEEYSRELILHFQRTPGVYAERWFQKLIQMPGRPAAGILGEQQLNPLSRILQIRDMAVEKAFLDFFYTFSDQLVGKCYDKRGTLVEPYSLRLHDKQPSLVPESFEMSNSGFKREGVEKVAQDTDLIKLIKRADYCGFCERVDDLKRDFGKIVAGEFNTALIQMCITFGAQNLQACPAFKEIATAEHGCQDKDGHTAAFYLARRQNVKSLEILLKYEDEVYFSDFAGRKCRIRTILHEACTTMNLALVKRIAEGFPKLLPVPSVGDGGALSSALLVLSFERNYDSCKTLEETVCEILSILPVAPQEEGEKSAFAVIVSSSIFPQETKEVLAETVAKKDNSKWVTPEGYNQLMLCAKFNIASALQYYQKQAGEVNVNNEFAALLAMRHDSKKTVFRLIEEEHRLKYRGDSLIHIAIKERKIDIALFIAEKGYCAREEDSDGRTALMLAVESRMDGLVSMLCKKESGIADELGEYAIHYALHSNNKQAFKYLFTEEFKVANESGVSLLQCALNSEQDASTKFILSELLKNTGSVREYMLFLRQNYSHEKNMSLHQQLALRDHEELFEFLLSYDTKLCNNERRAEDLVSELLKLSCAVEFKTKYVLLVIERMRYKSLEAPTPLMYAAANRIELGNELFSLLFSKERAMAPEFEGMSTLQIAVLCGSNQLVEMLTAGRNDFSELEKRSLVSASLSKNEEAIKILIQFAGTRDEFRRTALMHCAEQNYVAGCRALIDHEKGITSDTGETALWFAVKANALQAAIELSVAKEERVEVNSETLLSYCIRASSDHLERLFCGFSGENEEKALEIAIRKDNAKAVRMLVGSQKMECEELRNAIRLAIQENSEDSAMVLLEISPDSLNGSEENAGELPELFWAVLHGNDRLCCLCERECTTFVDSSIVCAAVLAKEQILTPDSLQAAISERLRLNDSGDEERIIPRSGQITASMLACVLNDYACLLQLYSHESKCLNATTEMKAVDYAILNDAEFCLQVIGNDRGPLTERIVRELRYESILEKSTRNI